MTTKEITLMCSIDVLEVNNAACALAPHRHDFWNAQRSAIDVAEHFVGAKIGGHLLRAFVEMRISQRGLPTLW